MDDVAVAVVGNGPGVPGLLDALADAVPGVWLPRPPSGELPEDLAGLDGVVVDAGAVSRGAARAAVEAGVPVLCAPPAGDVVALGALLEAERAAGRTLVRAGFPRRHDPRLRELRRQAEDGAVGALRLVRGVEACVDADEGLLHALDTLAWLTGTAVTDLRVEDGDGVRLVSVGTGDGPVADLELRLADAPVALRWELSGTEGSACVEGTAAHLAEAQRILLTAWARTLGTPAAAGASALDGYVAALALQAASGSDARA